MSVDSRTVKSLKNSTIALITYVINLVLQFFSRKVFLEYLGSEILGLNTTAVTLLQFLNLAELGISSAVSFTLYKPLHDKDTVSINEILTLQRGLYRRIAWIVTGSAIVLMLFFPLIFKKMELPLWYAYATFGVLLFSAMLGYFVNYKQIILTASQQDYKVIYSYKFVLLIKLAVQMWAVSYFEDGYIWWLIIEFIFAIIASISLELIVKKSFGYLSVSPMSFGELKSKYQIFFLKIKQLFFHKIGLFALTQTSPLIIYAFTTLTVVTLYGNYLIITSGLQVLFVSMFNSVGAGVGSLVVEGDRHRILSVFEELFSIRFLLIAISIFCFWKLSPMFITLWIGKEYVLPQITVTLILANLYIQLSRVTVDNFINAYGLFKDIWAPVIEAILNIGLSIILGYFYGLNGVLLGVFISAFVIIFCWKPYFLFANTIKGYYKKYMLYYLKHIFVFVIAFFIVSVIQHYSSNVLSSLSNSWGKFIIQTTIDIFVFGTLLCFLMIICRTRIYDSILRISNLIKRR